MKNIFHIYSADIRRIVRNWAAAVIIGGLALLPSLYAWFNIEASWDPYGQTSGVSIAVANLDKGTTLRDQPINLGKEIVESLHHNEKLGWRFTEDSENAIQGVRRGTDYAAIVIPENFSARIGTVLTNEPVKAQILYYTNEKINAISPKVTAQGASAVVEEVSKNFIKTANGTIFEIFNTLGIEIENQLPAINKVRSLLFRLEKSFPELNEAVSTAQQDIKLANRLVEQADAALPRLEGIATDGKEMAGALAEFANQAAGASKSLEPALRQDLEVLGAATGALSQVLDALGQKDIDPKELASRLNAAKERAETAAQAAARLGQLFKRLGSISPAAASAAAKLEDIAARWTSAQAALQSIAQAVERGEEAPADSIDKLKKLTDDINGLTDALLSRYDSEIGPAISKAFTKGAGTAKRVQQELTQALGSVPDIQRLLQDARKGLKVGGQEVQLAQNRLPEAELRITQLANRLREMEAEGDIQEIIDLLQNNFELESQFFAEPVTLEENRLYPIPNYGSAMSPFFTTLSLWVGALLLVSLLSVDVHDEERSFRSIEVYFGRYLTFLTIALFQALFVTLGDIYLLGAYVVNPGWFILFALLISCVFMLIVYTLVSVFGNVGKAMAIVLLVLQLAGAGGTFPIQMTPPFFQALHPYLPFTYAISMMREAVGGILWDIVIRDMLLMLVFAAIALVIGIALKKPINRASSGLIRKAKASKLIH
ncbi:YhgE/Pip domain-containing protein [Paenibacillus sp. FSL H8-0457]|uniref:YhgE/Pip domain-containing protein n=1 Tax=Paenibacillus TaxID=44249 RepID=UPI000178A1CD|nr:MULTISPECIES: YhgE/Pip domain-containing protein [Paenibacillus]ACX64321.1 YhgE/Pip C-terminal domain protein [Paenibacillus sp. Y412MC10]ETT57921.1 YhgE/Pip C-terminal domain-containing protein [Paenibacillus sp. FSL H8-457]MCM3256646.1 YhgE/Pip domain-containing protein [Paenibacillus lautus]